MEENRKSPTPPPCPSSVTVRRNPHRKARATPWTTTSKPLAVAPASAKPHDVPAFPIDEILSMQVLQPESKSPPVLENLKVFLRIKPLKSCTKVAAKSRPRNVWPQNPSKKNRNPEIAKKMKTSEEVCITVNDPCSVTLTPPSALQELKRSKTEVYEGFSNVFPPNCSQSDVYEKMAHPLLEDFLRGKSGMLAALGPSGSGKTHTVFGSPRDPGIVPLALRRIFSQKDENSPGSSRLFYLSVFEICSERGKGERASDLLRGGGSELSVKQSTIKGLQEVLIKNVEEAESLIGQAVLKRATAMTNSNSQSSRSQCIINIRAACVDSPNGSGVQSSDAMLTIVDLAGAEREKRTGNQGERLVESNFINNTSMVFGQCLRSLLEYQKNRKKGLQKHYQNSLLTRYLRDYLEGKKRMALILTVKAGEEDYLDTSFLLKQASPYMKIKFDNADEPCNKRQLQTFPRSGINKRIKLSAPKTSQVEDVVGGEKNQVSAEVCLRAEKADKKDRSSPGLDRDKNERDHIIMRNFAKVLWSVLKQYNEKLKVAESEICSLKDNLGNEKLKSLGLEKELISLRSACLSSNQKLAEACVPEVEAAVHAKEPFAVDASLVSEVRNANGDYSGAIETKGDANAKVCRESVAASKSVVKDAGLVQRSMSSDNGEQPRPVSSDDIVGIATTSLYVEIGSVDHQRDQCCDNSAVAENKDKDSNESNGLKIKDSHHGLDVKGSGSVVSSSQSGDSDGSSSYSVLELTLEPPRGDMVEDASTLSPKQVEYPRECSNGLSDIPTKSTRSSRSPNSEEKERLLTSSELLAEEKNSSDMKKTDKSQEENAPTPSEKQVEVSQECYNVVLDNQSKTSTSPTVPDSEEPKRNRRLFPSTSGFLADEMNPLDIENTTEKPKDQTLVKPVAESAPGHDTEVADNKSKAASTKKPKKAEKPKRRLLPASSVLLTRDIKTLDIEDDVMETKGNRGGRKKTMEEGKQRSQGSATLFRLLTTNLRL
ncbi:PREDICTED: kinesin-like protein KIN-6 isoform X5 [Tarenaya hassleriana]|uniref:kinesin-like protein KIN-6 isoform X5 n=1 Tax=Tarenaya hassleriana TaxID=28532 RepID=UPI00053C44BB|nr:PREDICTED: kinesin-like protein KIN-6 isoform X5 [Tarenaya hassleriana]